MKITVTLNVTTLALVAFNACLWTYSIAQLAKGW